MIKIKKKSLRAYKKLLLKKCGENVVPTTKTPLNRWKYYEVIIKWI